MRKLTALAAAVTFLASQGAAAQTAAEWTPVSATVTGTQFFARASELASSPASASPSVWVRQVPSAAQGVGWSEGHALYKVNCAQQSYEILSVTVYYDNGATETHSGEGVVRTAMAGTPVADLVTRVCPAATPVSVAALAAPNGKRF